VERAEAYARAHAGTPVPISRLCRVVGLSERALRNAFYGVRGMSPKRCMLVEREAEYQADIRRRMALVMAGPDERVRESIKAKKLPEDHGPLFERAARVEDAE
jgi:AraC-like DNA-binding protein